MDASSMSNLWNYLQGLSLTASNRKWLSDRLLEPQKEKAVIPPVLHTWEEAISDLEDSEKEFAEGNFVAGEEFDNKCKALLRSFDS